MENDYEDSPVAEDLNEIKRTLEVIKYKPRSKVRIGLYVMVFASLLSNCMQKCELNEIQERLDTLTYTSSVETCVTNPVKASATNSFLKQINHDEFYMR